MGRPSLNLFCDRKFKRKGILLRFPADPQADRLKAAEAYHDAMREVSKEFSDDLDAATLFAESGMNLHPWGLWHQDGTPEAGTEEIVASLESVMRRNPNHLGAIHYYIRTVEAWSNPERALAGANKVASLAPAAGHIVHMPAHVYLRTGDYAAAVKTNEEAAAVDRAYLKASGLQGIYSMMFYSHNLPFIAMCSALDGNYEEAKKNADMLSAHVGPHVKEMPPLEGWQRCQSFFIHFCVITSSPFSTFIPPTPSGSFNRSCCSASFFCRASFTSETGTSKSPTLNSVGSNVA